MFSHSPCTEGQQAPCFVVVLHIITVNVPEEKTWIPD